MTFSLYFSLPRNVLYNFLIFHRNRSFEICSVLLFSPMRILLFFLFLDPSSHNSVKYLWCRGDAKGIRDVWGSGKPSVSTKFYRSVKGVWGMGIRVVNVCSCKRV